MAKLKIGDRVSVYDKWKITGTVHDICGNDITVKSDETFCLETYHIKQCRKLVKSKHREWWINESGLRKGKIDYSSIVEAFPSWYYFFGNQNGKWISTTKPENTDGWICVREVKK